MSHISDHSASNHKVQVVKKSIDKISNDNICEYRLEILNIIKNVYSESSNLIVSRSGHEAIWYHRRSIFEILLKYLINWDLIKALEIIDTSFYGIPEFENDMISWNDSFEYFFDTLNNFFSATGCLNNLTAVQNIFKKWIAFECSFCISSIRPNPFWDNKSQKNLAFNYLQFIFFRVNSSPKIYIIYLLHFLTIIFFLLLSLSFFIISQTVQTIKAFKLHFNI